MSPARRTQLRPADLLSLDDLQQAAECLRAIAHPRRLRVIEILLRGKFTVGEIAELCGASQPVASLDLRLLQHRGLLRSHREGRTVYYEISEPHLSSIFDCVSSRYGCK